MRIYFKKRRLIFLLLVILLNFLIFLFLYTLIDFDKSLDYQLYDQKRDRLQLYNTANDFAFNLSISRLNKLFRILKKKELEYENVFNKLNVIQFDDIVKLKNGVNDIYNRELYNSISNDMHDYFNIDSVSGIVEANENFIDYLNSLSYYYSYTRPRGNVLIKEDITVCLKTWISTLNILLDIEYSV